MSDEQATSSIPRVLVFLGDDSIGREKAKEEQLSALSAHYPDIEEEHFDSTNDTVSDFLSRYITPSLFASHRIFSIRHVNSFREKDVMEIARAVHYDVPDAHLVLEIDEQTRKSQATTLVKKLGLGAGKKKNAPSVAIFDFTKPPDYKLAEWLSGQVERLFNRRMPKSTAEYLIDCVGTELESLYSQLQKIDILLSPSAPVDKDAIDSVIGSTRTMSAFELANAAVKRDFSRILDIIDSLFATEFFAPVCTSALFRQFWNLYRIRVFLQGNSGLYKEFKNARYTAQTEVAYQIGVEAGLLKKEDPVKKAYPVIILSGIIDTARTFSESALADIFSLLREYDVGIKTGRIPPDKQSIQMLCYKIIRAGQPGEEP